VAAAQFTVSKDRNAQFLLTSQNTLYVGIFKSAQALWIKCRIAPRFQ
jgi:hypothetical protein